MADQGNLYDPYVKRGEQGATTGGDPRTARLQSEIQDTVNHMEENMRRAQQRGANVDELQNRTDALATQANTFKSGANRVRKQMWWKDMKMRMCIIVGIILLLVVIIVPSVIASNKHHNN